MPYYIPNFVSKTSCIGNALSTFNISFSSLDTNLHNLSTYTINSINYLSSQIGYLSSQIAEVSGTLNTRINYLSSSVVGVSGNLSTAVYYSSTLATNAINTLSTNINYVSANVVGHYIKQGNLICPSNGGTLNWNFSTIGNNAYLPLSANIRLGNPTGLSAGQTGNLIINVTTVGKTITSFDTSWTFTGNVSSLATSVNSRNVISYYYDGSQLLSSFIKFIL
jgi:hypothetical protein